MGKKLIILLTIIFISICVYIGFTCQQKTKSVQQLHKEQTVINNEVEKWKQTEEIIKSYIHSQNQLIVLEGTQEIKKTYNITDNEVAYQGSDSFIKFLANTLNSWKTKSITIQTTYQYNFVYDMNSIDVSIDNTGVATVILNETNISLKPLAELNDKRTISDEHGFLSSSFTSSQISAVMFNTGVHSYNTLINDSSLYSRAIQNTQDDLTKLVDKFGVKKVNFQVIHNNVETNDEVQEVNN